ncbi:MAG: hypothetical protein WA418_10545 [Bradyrhizobium sp.]
MAGCVEGIVERIHRVAVDGLSHPDANSLLHAYIACLPVPDLCLGILETLAEPSVRRSALRRRLLRLLRDGDLQPPDLKLVCDLIEECRLAGRDKPKVRVSVDTLLSSVFAHLPPTQQHSIVQTWMDRGTTGAAGRWLKAVAEVPALFDERAIIAYYKASDDERAEKLLANRASAAFLEEILPKLAERCDRGWVLSKAALRASRVDEAVWPIIRARHPATYLYLGARLHRRIPEEEALEIALICPNSIMNETRGLAIWAVGQMGMIRVLDQIVARGEELDRKDRAEFESFPG